MLACAGMTGFGASDFHFAVRGDGAFLDCFAAALLAMTRGGAGGGCGVCLLMPDITEYMPRPVRGGAMGGDFVGVRGRSGGIQALRALAWFLVLFDHVTFFTCYAKGLNQADYRPIDTGQIGVSIFFIISGYVMGGCMPQGRLFLWNRAARIFPPFWIAVVLSHFIERQPAWHWNFVSLALLPTTHVDNSYEIPFWTLCYEMVFYYIVYALILLKVSRKGLQFFCIFWLFAIVVFDIYRVNSTAAAAMIGFIDPGEPGKFILLSPLCEFFVVGFFVSISGHKFLDNVPAVYLILLSGALWCLKINDNVPSPAIGFFVLALSYVCLLVAFKRLQVPRFIIRLGDYSYGAYLVHYMLIIAVVSALQPYAAHMGFAVLWMAILLPCAAGGILFGWFEHQLHTRFIKGIFSRRLISRPQ
jgi:peptidoglycan/LPS O-acetylase OafA/YrhL